MPVENNANKNGKNLQQYKNGKFKCVFIRYGIQFYLGYFNTKEEAVKAKKEKLKEIERDKHLYMKNYSDIIKLQTKGVYHTPSGKWRADVIYNGKQHRIGTFNSPEEAKAAREDFIRNLPA